MNNNFLYKLNNLLRPTNLREEKNTKVYECGSVLQVYSFGKSKLVSKEKLEIENIQDNLINKNNYQNNFKTNLKTIEYKNLIRSKNSLIRLVNTNINKFKSFLTLTFEDNINDINIANYELKKFIGKIKRKFPNFLYIGVPEFQKNGRVHYHLLTNIDFYVDCILINENKLTSQLYQKYNKSQINQFINDNKEDILKLKYSLKDLNKLSYCFRLINGKYENTKCSYNKKTKQYKVFKTINYWKKGFSNIVPLDNIDIIGYISKYLTKDYDNRLYSHHRYYYSRNLTIPTIKYYYLSNEKDIFKLYNLNEKEIFKNTYYDKFGNEILFFEYKKK